MQKKVPYVAQLGNMDCSIACMTMLFRYYGLDVDIVDVGQVVHIGRDGVNLTQLKQATQQFGFKCTAYRYNKQKNILDSNLPAVVYSGSHLAVIGSKTVLGQYILLLEILLKLDVWEWKKPYTRISQINFWMNLRVFEKSPIQEIRC